MKTVAVKLDQHFDTVIAILITITVMTGALVAWRASLVGVALADRAVLIATRNAEMTRFLNDAKLYRHYRAYTTYTLNHELQRQIEKDLDETAAAELPDLTRQQTEAMDLASISQVFFPMRYLNRDGSYDIQRQLGEAWAQAGQKLDLNPEPHLARAAQQRVKSSQLKAILIVKALSVLFYNITKVLHPGHKSWRYTMAFGGTLCLIFGVAATVAVERFL